MNTAHNYSRSAAAKLFGLSRPTLVRLDEIKPELAPKRINKTTVAYSLEQLAAISNLYRKEPNLTVAEELNIPKHLLLNFYCELPTPKTPVPSPSDFSDCNNLALSLCEQLRLLADGVYRELPLNLARIFRKGFSEHKSRIHLIASILAEIDRYEG